MAQPATAAGWYPREGQAAGHSLPAADRATAGVGSVVGVRSSWLPPAHRTPYWHKPTVGGFVDSGSHDLCADARLAGPMSGAACERDLAAAARAGSTHRGAVSVAVQASSRFPATPHSSRCGCRGPPLGPGTWRQRCSRGSRCRSRTRRLRAHGADPSAGSRHTSALHLRADGIGHWDDVENGFKRRGREGRRAAKLVRLMEATSGFEPLNRGFADLRLGPLGYVAPIAAGVPVRGVWLPLEDSNLGSRIQSPASYH